MDIDSVRSVADPRRATWSEGDAWLAGGSWLFSTPQPGTVRLLDLFAYGWPPLTVQPDGLHIAATCTLAELAAFSTPPDWLAADLFGQCVHALLGSFKVHTVATVGGNLCLALPAGPMISLGAALDGQVEVWSPDGSRHRVPVLSFVTGAGQTVLAPDQLVRELVLPLSALRSRTAFRQISLSPLGRSGALVIARRSGRGVVVTVTASTRRPVQAVLPYGGAVPDLLAEIDAAAERYYDDVHGSPVWRRAMTHRLVGEVVAELDSV